LEPSNLPLALFFKSKEDILKRTDRMYISTCVSVGEGYELNGYPTVAAPMWRVCTVNWSLPELCLSPSKPRKICLCYTVPKISGKVRVIRHSDSGASPNKPDFSAKINA
jgi:hypothetical protein